MILVTGATGQLGHLIINALLQKIPAHQIIAGVRTPERAGDLAAQGVQVRHVDYNEPATLDTAFQGVDKLLLISSSEVGKRAAQHGAAINAAKGAGVKLVAYTSILHADTSPMSLAVEHRASEAALRESGIPFVILRNGWYTENYTEGIPAALQYGVIQGSAGNGRISSAARSDYADAAVAVLFGEDHAGKTYELAGDDSYTLSELAAEVAKQSGNKVEYQDIPQTDYEKVLVGIGLPQNVATMLAESDVRASQGWLFDESHQLGQLIGRSTVPFSEVVAKTLQR